MAGRQVQTYFYNQLPAPPSWGGRGILFNAQGGYQRDSQIYLCERVRATASRDYELFHKLGTAIIRPKGVVNTTSVSFARR